MISRPLGTHLVVRSFSYKLKAFFNYLKKVYIKGVLDFGLDNGLPRYLLLSLNQRFGTFFYLKGKIKNRL